MHGFELVTKAFSDSRTLLLKTRVKSAYLENFGHFETLLYIEHVRKLCNHFQSLILKHKNFFSLGHNLWFSTKLPKIKDNLVKEPDEPGQFYMLLGCFIYILDSSNSRF